MNRVTLTFIAMFLLLLSGCATVPFAPVELTPTIPRSAAELSGGLWNAGNGSLVIRQSALFEFEGMRVPIVGVMKLDRTARIARLVGMNDMGVKLYDLSVDAAASQAHFIMPELARYPGFAEAVAASVRRIFLAPEPTSDDALERTSTSYVLTRKAPGGGVISFVFGGADAQLLEKSYRGATGSWRVRYYQYQRLSGHLFPGGIVLDDDRAGYRLTLWIESVEKTDE